jgi:hypothetical protein
MKYIKEFNETDPYNEEVWENSDPITKKLKEELLQKNTRKGNRLAERLKDYPVDTPLKIYELKNYMDGGLNDSGDHVGYVKARYDDEALAIGYLNGYNADGTGWGILREEEIQRKLADLQKKVHNILNMPTTDNYK